MNILRNRFWGGTLLLTGAFLVCCWGNRVWAMPDTTYVVFDGMLRTRTSYLQRFIVSGSIPGADSSTLSEDLRRLRSLPSVLDAGATTLATDSGTLIRIRIAERYTLFPVGDFGVSRDGYWVGGGIMESNLLGCGLYAYGYYQYNERNTLHLIFRNPYVMGSRWGYELQYKRQPVYETYRNRFTVLNELNHLSLGMRYEIRYEHELTTGLAWYRQQAAVWSSDPLTRGEFPDQQFSGIELFLLEDIRKLDNHYYFIDGWRNRLHLSYQPAWSPKRPGVLHWVNEFSYYKRTGSRGNMASRLSVGYSNEPEELFQPFVADSYYTLRGIGYRAFHSSGMALSNLEYRHAWWEGRRTALQTNVFTDMGYFYSSGGLAGRNDRAAFQCFGGMGLRFIYKQAYNAILCIDYGFDLLYGNPGSWVVGWGQFF